MYYSMDKTQQTAGDNSATKTARDGECCTEKFIFIYKYWRLQMWRANHFVWLHFPNKFHSTDVSSYGNFELQEEKNERMQITVFMRKSLHRLQLKLLQITFFFCFIFGVSFPSLDIYLASLCTYTTHFICEYVHEFVSVAVCWCELGAIFFLFHFVDAVEWWMRQMSSNSTFVFFSFVSAHTKKAVSKIAEVCIRRVSHIAFAAQNWQPQFE